MPGPFDQPEQAQKDAEKADRSAADNPSAKAYSDAANEWRGVAAAYRKLAQAGTVDWCAVAEALLRCALDLERQAAEEKNAADAITDWKEAARVFDAAADLFLKCGDAAMSDEDYSKAIGAYAKAADQYGRRAGVEKTIEEHYAALVKKNPNDGVAKGQTAQAQARRKDAEKSRDKAKEKQRKAREKFLE